MKSDPNIRKLESDLEKLQDAKGIANERCRIFSHNPVQLLTTIASRIIDKEIARRVEARAAEEIEYNGQCKAFEKYKMEFLAKSAMEDELCKLASSWTSSLSPTLTSSADARVDEERKKIKRRDAVFDQDMEGMMKELIELREHNGKEVSDAGRPGGATTVVDALEPTLLPSAHKPGTSTGLPMRSSPRLAGTKTLDYSHHPIPADGVKFDTWLAERTEDGPIVTNKKRKLEED